MAQAQALRPPHKLGFLDTLRKDRWWVEPVAVFIGLSIFFGWLAVSAFLDELQVPADLPCAIGPSAPTEIEVVNEGPRL